MEYFLGKIPPSACIGNIPLYGKFPRWDFSYNSVFCVQSSAAQSVSSDMHSCSCGNTAATEHLSIHKPEFSTVFDQFGYKWQKW